MEKKHENIAAGAAVSQKAPSAADAAGQPPQAARPQGCGDTCAEQTQAQQLESRLRAEFAETMQIERERAAREQQETLGILRKERAEAAAAIALTRAGARSLKAARALLSVDPAGFEDEREAEAFAAGLQAQIDALKSGEDTGFLFRSGSRAVLCGFIPAEGRDEPFGGAPAAMSLGDAVRRALSPGE